MLTLVLTSFLCAAALRKKAGSSVGSSTPNHEKPDQDHRGANALGARMRGHVLPFMLCREHDQELLLKRRQLSGKGKGPKEPRFVVWDTGRLGKAAVAMSIAFEGDRNHYGALPRCLLMHT